MLLRQSFFGHSLKNEGKKLEIKKIFPQRLNVPTSFSKKWEDFIEIQARSRLSSIISCKTVQKLKVFPKIQGRISEKGKQEHESVTHA